MQLKFVLGLLLGLFAICGLGTQMAQAGYEVNVLCCAATPEPNCQWCCSTKGYKMSWISFGNTYKSCICERG